MPQLNPGDTAPSFELPDTDLKPVSLAAYAGRRVIVYFFPAALTPGCTIEAVDFNAALDKLAAAGFDVVGISPDEPTKLATFKAKENLSFPLLGDPDRAVLDAYGAFGSKKLYGKVVTGVIRSTFIIDVDADGVGHLAAAQYNVRATGHVAKLLRELGLAA
ncbi:MAG: peroxiredoxin [Propionibacteriaceae bacterium]|jgi:peroxiredoxin Q/BCP|nr:peroxiredoxin [Propionibacteriaceae bacterium]